MRLLLPALLLTTAPALAQPTLTSSTNLPTPGLTNTLYRASSAPATTTAISGANVTWDYSTLSSSATVASTYAACPGTAFCDSFPTANLNGLEVLSNNTLFYNASSSALSIVGSRGAGATGGTAVNTYYSDPEDFLRFPMNYNSSYTDASRAAYTAFGFPASRSASTTVVADGWGTLKLPGNNNFSNVLRVKRTSTVFDTVHSNPFPQNATANVTMYLWYSPSYKEFLMLVVQATSTIGNATAVAWTLPNLAGVDDASGNFHFTASPNPVHDRIAVRWTSGTEAALALQDLTGRTVLQTAGRGEASMDVANMPRGLYVLRATSADGSSRTQKIVLQ